MYIFAVGGARGALTFMVFLVFLLLAAWCMKIYRGAQRGFFTTGQKIINIIGGLLLLGLLLLTAIPLLK